MDEPKRREDFRNTEKRLSCYINHASGAVCHNPVSQADEWTIYAANVKRKMACGFCKSQEPCFNNMECESPTGLVVVQRDITSEYTDDG